jgi:hypothetical protein
MTFVRYSPTYIQKGTRGIVIEKVVLEMYGYEGAILMVKEINHRASEEIIKSCKKKDGGIHYHYKYPFC